MIYVELIKDSFWQVMTAMVPAILPILVVILLFQLIRGVLLK
jgi:hypothetical protein